MTKEFRSFVKILRSRLHKALGHQWFLNQYAHRHRLNQFVIGTNRLLYDKDQRLISFKGWIVPSPPGKKLTPMELLTASMVQPRTRRQKPLTKSLYAETAPLVLVRNINQRGGGWYADICSCSLCSPAFQSFWSSQFLLNKVKIEQVLKQKAIRPCQCGYNKKLLTACKPVMITKEFGIVSQAFLQPQLLAKVSYLLTVPSDKFRQVALAGTGYRFESAKLNNVTRSTIYEQLDTGAFFGGLLQFMFFWMKNGDSIASKLFHYYVLPASKKKRSKDDLEIRDEIIRNVPQLDIGIGDVATITIAANQTITFRQDDGQTIENFSATRPVSYTEEQFIETFGTHPNNIINIQPALQR